MDQNQPNPPPIDDYNVWRRGASSDTDQTMASRNNTLTNTNQPQSAFGAPPQQNQQQPQQHHQTNAEITAMLRPSSTKQNKAPSQREFQYTPQHFNQTQQQYHQQAHFTEQNAMNFGGQQNQNSQQNNARANPSPQNVRDNSPFDQIRQQTPQNLFNPMEPTPQFGGGQGQFSQMHQPNRFQQPGVQNIPPEQLRQMGQQQQHQYSNSQYMQNNTNTQMNIQNNIIPSSQSMPQNINSSTRSFQPQQQQQQHQPRQIHPAHFQQQSYQQQQYQHQQHQQQQQQQQHQQQQQQLHQQQQQQQQHHQQQQQQQLNYNQTHQQGFRPQYQNPTQNHGQTQNSGSNQRISPSHHQQVSHAPPASSSSIHRSESNFVYLSSSSSVSPVDVLRDIEKANAKVVKRGHLEKKGEMLKNWRTRYFVLYSNGLMLGWHDNPLADTNYDDDRYWESAKFIQKPPMNNFHVKQAQVSVKDSKSYGLKNQPRIEKEVKNQVERRFERLLMKIKVENLSVDLVVKEEVGARNTLPMNISHSRVRSIGAGSNPTSGTSPMVTNNQGENESSGPSSAPNPYSPVDSSGFDENNMNQNDNNTSSDSMHIAENSSLEARMQNSSISESNEAQLCSQSNKSYQTQTSQNQINQNMSGNNQITTSNTNIPETKSRTNYNITSIMEECGKPVNTFRWRHNRPHHKISKEQRDKCRFNVMLSHNSVGRVNQQTPRQFSAYEEKDHQDWIYCIELVKLLNRRGNELSLASFQASSKPVEITEIPNQIYSQPSLTSDRQDSDVMGDATSVRERERLVPPEKIIPSHPQNQNILHQFNINKQEIQSRIGDYPNGQKNVKPFTPRVIPNIDAIERMHNQEYHNQNSEFMDTREEMEKLGQREKGMTISDFERISVLGRGSFGKVYLVREKRNLSKYWAMKLLRKDVIQERKEEKHTESEAKIIQKLRHPFLSKCMYSFEDRHRICHVLEYANGGELYEHLSRDRCFSERRAKFYAAEITSALYYLHKKRIVYRDLKLENILLDHEGHIMLTDFGLCKEVAANNSMMTTLCGTPEYLAPEVLDDDTYAKTVDWWSFGVVLYEMLTGRLPFYHQEQQILFERILIAEPAPLPQNLTPNCQDITFRLLMKDPDQRIGCSDGGGDGLEIMGHPWFAEYDFEMLYHRQIEPPWKPELSAIDDLRYFSRTFTEMPRALTPDSELNFEAVNNYPARNAEQFVNANIGEKSEIFE